VPQVTRPPAAGSAPGKGPDPHDETHADGTGKGGPAVSQGCKGGSAAALTRSKPSADSLGVVRVAVPLTSTHEGASDGSGGIGRAARGATSTRSAPPAAP
jgi:hypothetical protein